jgi:purine-binding chemotaxis protein CheW
VGRAVDAVSDLITPTRAQLRPVPESSSAIQSEHLRAFGAPDRRMVLLPDIENLIATAETGSVGQALP